MYPGTSVHFLLAATWTDPVDPRSLIQEEKSGASRLVLLSQSNRQEFDNTDGSSPTLPLRIPGNDISRATGEGKSRMDC